MRYVEKLLRETQPFHLALALIVMSTAIRLVYGVVITDPLSGPDAPTYALAAKDFFENGVTAEAAGIPYWPAGYPLFISYLYGWFGVWERIVPLVQALGLGVATYFAYTLVLREFGPRRSVLTVLLLSISPALLGATGMFMYETPFLVLMVIPIELLSRVSSSNRDRNMRLLTTAFAGILFGVAITFQPKAIFPAVLGALLLVARLRKRGAFLLIPFLITLLLAPTALVLRNYVAGKGVGLAANLGMAVIFEIQYVTDVSDTCGGGVGTFEQDREMVLCGLRWRARHPIKALKLGLTETAAYWGPMTGPLVTRGTWWHAFDYRRFLPVKILNQGWFEQINVIGGNVWTLLSTSLIALGAWILISETKQRLMAFVFLMIILSFYIVTFISIGDARYRLPTAPFYSTFQACAILWLWDLRRRKRGVANGS